EAIKGTWTVEAGGDLKGGTIVFSKTEIKMRFPGAKDEHSGSFKLDQTKNPKQIDIHMKSGEANIGIYSVEGDTLKIYAVPDTDRPSKFPDSNPMMIVLKRKKS